MKNSRSIAIDSVLCTGCGRCVCDCVAENIIIENNKAVCKRSECMECGHCFAVCPEGAVSMPKYDTKDCRAAHDMSFFDADDLLLAMKSRRSIRQFEDRPVEKEKIRRILEAGQYTPTAKNSQGLSYIVLEDDLKSVEEPAVAFAQKMQKIGRPFIKYLREHTIDDDFFFKKAPLVILVLGNSKVDAALASSYMELMAGSQGLGVMYSGFFVVAVKLIGRVKRAIGLSRKDKVITCLVIGYPAVKYQRIVPRREIKAKYL